MESSERESPVQIVCEFCATPFTTYASKRPKKHAYCSRRCGGMAWALQTASTEFARTRIKMNLTQKEFAARASVPPKVVEIIEQDEKWPSDPVVCERIRAVLRGETPPVVERHVKNPRRKFFEVALDGEELTLISAEQVRGYLESQVTLHTSLTMVVERTAKKIGVTPRTVWNYMERGVIAKVQPGTVNACRHFYNK